MPRRPRRKNTSPPRKRNPSPPLRTARGWALVSPAPDLKGQWLAHFLDFNVMSQGRSITEALTGLLEVVLLVVEHELEQGRDPFALKPAKREHWKRLHAVIEAGTLVDERQLDAIAERDVEALATQLFVFVPAGTARPTRGARPKAEHAHAAVYVAA